MGARSGVYCIYYAIIGVIMTIVSAFILGTVVPSIDTCKPGCPADLAPSNKWTTESYSAAYGSGLVKCDSAYNVLWACPAGKLDCTTDGLRVADTCVGAYKAVGWDGKTVNALFQGVGKYYVPQPEGSTGLGDYGICFTTPFTFAMRPAVYGLLIVFAAFYTLMAVLLMTNCSMLACFRFTKDRGWSKLSLCGRIMALLVRWIPRLMFVANAILMVAICALGVSWWGLKICTDATDQYGKYALLKAVDPALYVACVVFGLSCIGGGVFRHFVDAEGAFYEPDLYVPPKKNNANKPAKRSACAACCTCCCGVISKLGP